MGKKSGATNEVTEDNIKAVKEFLRAVEQLYKDKNTIENLNLKSKAPGLFTELYTVEKLYDKYHENYEIYWLGRGKKNVDIKLKYKGDQNDKNENICIQVKTITNIREKDPSNSYYKDGEFGFWLMRPNFKGYINKNERPPQLDISRIIKEEKKYGEKFLYPFIFVWFEAGRLRFFVYSAREMKETWESGDMLERHNAFLKNHWKSKGKIGNATAIGFYIKESFENKFDKLFEKNNYISQKC